MQEPIVHARPDTVPRFRVPLHRRFRTSHTTLLILASIAHILSSLLLYLDWDDLHSFLNSCKDGRSLFDNLKLRDAILSRYVPWYKRAASLRNAQNGYRDVPVSMKDLDLLLTSQRIPLHQYPIHARRVLTSPHPTQGADAISSWFRSMTDAHSRFVLLLQAYVHSPDVVQAEPEDMIWMSRYRAPRSPLRKLTFPAPLSYNNITVKERGAKNSFQSQNGRNVRPTCSKKRRPSTYFESSRVPNRSWTRLSMISQLSRDTGYASDDSISTHYPMAISIDSLPYSYASCSSSVSRNSLNPFATTSSSLGTDAPSPSIYPSYPIRMTSPLDFSFAISRKRAPILRVFVPCSELKDDSHELLLCEQQLIDAGLWDHLSVGDLVCNLGYVPPVEGFAVDTSPAFASLDDSPRSRRQSQFNPVFPYYNRLPQSRKWLLFNGEFLVPHEPPDPFSLPDPLSLPTPFYYTHILPPFINPIFIIDRLGLEDTQSTELETSLVHTTIKVPSPHSPAGYALVRKYAWTVRVLPPLWNSSQMVRCIGEGWVGEWILEGEGTKEGKETLIDCILGRTAGPLEWEVVVERCSGGRVWLRLLNLSWTRDTRPRFPI